MTTATDNNSTVLLHPRPLLQHIEELYQRHIIDQNLLKVTMYSYNIKTVIGVWQNNLLFPTNDSKGQLI